MCNNWCLRQTALSIIIFRIINRLYSGVLDLSPYCLNEFQPLFHNKHALSSFLYVFSIQSLATLHSATTHFFNFLLSKALCFIILVMLVTIYFLFFPLISLKAPTVAVTEKNMSYYTLLEGVFVILHTTARGFGSNTMYFWLW